MKILIIISGSIAAYKSLELIRELQKNKHEVNCILTKSGEKFITPLSVATLTEKHCYTDNDAFSIQENMKHISLTRNSDIILIVPATADIIAKAAYGIADELATTTLIASNTPVVIVPAMNGIMWQAKTTQRNIEVLKKDGVKIIEPQEGFMVCGEYGLGKMAKITDIIEFLKTLKIN